MRRTQKNQLTLSPSRARRTMRTVLGISTRRIQEKEPTMQVGLTEAARLTGKDASTITRACNSGRLSFTKDEAGNRIFDIAELERVYGPLRTPEEQRAGSVCLDRFSGLIGGASAGQGSNGACGYCRRSGTGQSRREPRCNWSRGAVSGRSDPLTMAV